MTTKIVIEYFKPNYMSGLYYNRYNPVSRVSLQYQHITHSWKTLFCVEIITRNLKRSFQRQPLLLTLLYQLISILH